MTNDQYTLERLRLWRQIETLVNELQNLIHDWYENDPILDDTHNRLFRNSPYHLQLELPFITRDYPPNPVQNPCPLCQIRRWP